MRASRIETIEDDASVRQPRPEARPALTILFHPDPARVGAWVEIEANGSVLLSRLEPTFRHGLEAGRALEDARLSRSPVKVTASTHGVRVDGAETKMRVRVDGAQVDGSTAVGRDRLAQGVVLEIAGRVALLLALQHPREAPRARHGLIGAGARIDELRNQIDLVAREQVPVLLRGESGTGKELVARAIHLASERAQRPFVPVNMAAIPSTTAAAELFGHRAGAFSGAGAAHAGYFGAAEAGTLFLDEIASTPLDVQAMLLRVLESGEVQPLGGRAPRSADVRIIAAADAAFEREVADGSFRAPLLHRLSAYVLRLAPLRTRREDIPLLLLHFLREESAGAVAATWPEWLTAGVMARLVRYPWPGNVRELRNVARRLRIDGESKNALRDEAWAQAALDELLVGDAEPAEESVAAEPSAPPTRTKLTSIDDEQLLGALRRNRWQVGASARELGISKNSLYRLMERCSAVRRAKDVPSSEIAKAFRRFGGDVDRMSEALEVSPRGLKLRLTEEGMVSS